MRGYYWVRFYNQVFSILKYLFFEAKARTIEATWNSIGSLLNTFQPEECSNYFVMWIWLRLNAKRSSRR